LGGQRLWRPARGRGDRSGVGDKAEQAYRRSDALEKRRKLMEAWAAYSEPRNAGNVVQMGKRDRS
jgi:hypothetical protein